MEQVGKPSIPMDKETGTISWELPANAGTCGNCSLVIREDQTQGQLIGNYTLQCQHECRSRHRSRSESDDVDDDVACTARTASGRRAEPWGACEMGGLSGVIPNASALTGVGHKRILMLVVGAGLLPDESDATPAAGGAPPQQAPAASASASVTSVTPATATSQWRLSWHVAARAGADGFVAPGAP